MGFIYMVEPTAAATWVVGENILDQENWINKDNWARRVVRVGVAGSDAEGECEIELKYGERTVGRFRNTTAAACGVSSFNMQPVSSRLIVRPNEEIQAILRNSQSGTNKLVVALDVKDIARKRASTGYRRRY